MKNVSIGAQIKQLGGMVDTPDLNDRENGFVKNMVDRTGNGQNTTDLTERQVDWLADLYKKHFG